MEDVYVVGVGMTPFGQLADVSIKDMTRQAVEAALADAGVGGRCAAGGVLRQCLARATWKASR